MQGEGSTEAAVLNTEPRSALGIVASTFELYWRYPWLFLALAALVIVPYELVVLAATGDWRLDQSSLPAGLSFLLATADVALVLPLVSALHVHAVRAILAEEQPRIGAVTRLGLAALPVVAAVTIISWLGIVLGFVALVVPGIYLFLRWYVVAQAAAIEREGWSDALRRSTTLVSGNYRHVFGLGLVVLMIGFLPGFLIKHAFGDLTGPLFFFTWVAVEVLVWSFTALTGALLYFDLRARRQRAYAQGLAEAPPGAGPVLTPKLPVGEEPVLAQEPFDAVDAAWGSGSHSDEERPPGWYVDPTASDRLRYWSADPSGWGKSVRMSRKMRREIRKQEEERGRPW